MNLLVVGEVGQVQVAGHPELPQHPAALEDEAVHLLLELGCLTDEGVKDEAVLLQGEAVELGLVSASDLGTAVPDHGAGDLEESACPPPPGEPLSV